MYKSLLHIIVLLLISHLGFAENSYRIEIKLTDYTEKELYLAYHYGDKQYIKDTALINDQGTFIFEGNEPLDIGVYLVVMAPNNTHFQVLMNEEEQEFKLTTSAASPSQKMKIKGSKDNELFFEYLNFLAAKRPIVEQLQKDKEGITNPAQLKSIEDKIEQVNLDVSSYQQKIINEYPNTLTSLIIKANLPFNFPEFTGDDQEKQVQRWRFMQQHYFDNLEMGHPVMLRTPFLFSRIDHFVHKLNVQHPDTISQAIDEVMKRLKPAEESFKYYLIHFLNYYAKSKIVGMDAVYVHLVEKYFETGMAPWTDDEQLKKIIDDAKALKPLLVGKVAPDIKMQNQAGDPVNLHSVASPITILYFWRYDCGHCKESTPVMKEFFEKYKDKGVKIFAVCTKYTDEVPDCWKYIDENEIGNWMHVVDPYGRSRYSKIYNIKSTPQVYVLDENKKILSKRIGAEQLEELIDRILEDRKKESEE